MKYFLILLLFISSLINEAQPTFFQRGIITTILPGTTLCIEGTYETDTLIYNDGRIIVTGDFINHSHTGVFTTATGEVIASGNNRQEILGESDWEFNDLSIDKVSG